MTPRISRPCPRRCPGPWARAISAASDWPSFLGGPAALFWMWATAFVGMTTKFVEVTVSHKYRKKDDNGNMVGGPMHYMEHGLNMKWLAVFFAVATVISSFGSGNLPQANNMAAGLFTSFDIPTWLSGAVLALLLGLVIVGGIRRIAVVAATLVPLMGILYAVGALAVVLSNYENVWPSLSRSRRRCLLRICRNRRVFWVRRLPTHLTGV